MSNDGRNLVAFVESELPKAVDLAIAELVARAMLHHGLVNDTAADTNAALEPCTRVLRRFVIEEARREEFREAVECGDYDHASVVIDDLIADGGPNPKWRAMRAKLEELKASRDRGWAGGA